MAKMSSLGSAVSGMHAAQTGLYVTGHNMANNGLRGFTRQQSIQNDSFYTNIGNNFNGKMQIGLGTDITCIRQIRDQFLDMSYRAEIGKLNFYNIKHSTGIDMEMAIGELQSLYPSQTVINDLWKSLQELTTNPSSIEARGNFISTSKSFITKMNNANERFRAQQDSLNKEVITTVNRINELTEKIHKLNNAIREQEMYGQNANDLRDERNNALDELSQLIKIDYKEDSKGVVHVHGEGKELVVNGIVNKLGFRYTAPDTSFVEPVFTDSKTILEYDPKFENARSLFEFTSTGKNIGEEDSFLKGLISSRGLFPSNYNSLNEPKKPNASDYPMGENDPNYIKAVKDYEFYFDNIDRIKFNAKETSIPKAMRELDTLFNKIVTMINDTLKGGYDLNGNISNINVFERKDGNGLYSLGNVIINKKLEDPNGYNLLGLGESKDKEDASLVIKLIEKWKKKEISIDNSEKMNVDDFYKFLVNNIAVKTSQYKNSFNSQSIIVQDIDAKRMQASGVSLDEEMSNMMKFQHAFNSASRMINTIDSMIDTLVNKTGRVGM